MLFIVVVTHRIKIFNFMNLLRLLFLIQFKSYKSKTKKKPCTLQYLIIFNCIYSNKTKIFNLYKITNPDPSSSWTWIRLRHQVCCCSSSAVNNIWGAYNQLIRLMVSHTLACISCRTTWSGRVRWMGIYPLTWK